MPKVKEGARLIAKTPQETHFWSKTLQFQVSARVVLFDRVSFTLFAKCEVSKRCFCQHIAGFSVRFWTMDVWKAGMTLIRWDKSCISIRVRTICTRLSGYPIHLRLASFSLQPSSRNAASRSTISCLTELDTVWFIQVPFRILHR